MADELSKSAISGDTKALMEFESQKKSVGVAYLLWFFLGMLGVHRFYAGKSGSGFLMLVIWVISLVLSLVYVGLVGFFILGVWWLIDAFLLSGIISEYNRSLMARITA